MKLKATTITGCFEIETKILYDERGSFIKTFHEENFGELGLVTNFVEEYYSSSHKGVLRGLHFQLPPHDHTKIVYCPLGEVLDVVVDLRKGSPTYGMAEMFNLNSKKGNMIYIPPGLAHGFFVLSDIAIMMYKVTSVYSPECDSGILWNSVNVLWPSNHPIISKRDMNFVELDKFESLFKYEGDKNESKK